MGQRGSTLLVVDGFNFVRNRRGGYKTYWICAKRVCMINRGLVNPNELICFFSLNFPGKHTVQIPCHYRCVQWRTYSCIPFWIPQSSAPGQSQAPRQKDSYLGSLDQGLGVIINECFVEVKCDENVYRIK